MAVNGEYEVSVETIPEAAAAIVQRRFCTITGAVPAASSQPLGVARYTGQIGKSLAVGTLGRFLCEAGAAFAEGDLLMVDNQGRVILRTAAQPIVGRARQASTQAGDIVLVAVGYGNGVT